MDQERQTFEADLQALIAQTDEEPDENSITMVILAAGYGTRLAAEADRVPELRGKPKALLPVGGKPILDWLLECVKDIPEIHRIVLVTNEKFFDQLEDWRSRAAEPSYRSIKIISDGSRTNDERRGAIGALHFAVTREDIKGNVLVIGADDFFAGSFKELSQAFLQKKVGMVVTHDEGSRDKIAGRLGVVTQDVRGQIIDFEEKPANPKSSFASTLCYMLNKDNLRSLKGYVRGCLRPDNTGDFIKHLVTEGERLEAFQFKGEWHDIGNLSEYQSLRDSVARAESATAKSAVKP
jgi:glucose-1-phosphate thymidylyltransferase